MKLKIEAIICMLYEGQVIHLQLSAEVIIVYDDDDGIWRFHICYTKDEH